MIKLKVKSTWQGKVGIRDKYVQQALDEKKGLEITCQAEIMIIPAEEVQKRIVAKSDRPFRNKFGKGYHYLIYFDWKPLANQRKLFNEKKEKNKK